MNLFKCCFCSTSFNTIPLEIQLKWTIFTYKELSKATKNFDQCHCLGKRGFGAVYYGKLEDGREIAVQRFHEDKHHVFQEFIEKPVILKYLPHKNLVSIYGFTSLENESLLVHEYLSNGTLASYFQGQSKESSTLSWQTRLDIAIDAANALFYLHNHDIIHRDFKSSNILLDKNFCAKVANFHSSRKLPRGVSTHVTSDIIGTCGYIDPEYVSHGRLSVKNDVYSFGVVLCELISSRLEKGLGCREEDSLANFVGRKIENQALEELLDPRVGYKFDHEIKQIMTAVAELAVQCLQCPQELRPYMTQVLGTLQGIRQGRYEINTINAMSDFRIFHNDELEKATNHFDTCLGMGGFGAVYYGKLDDGREVAVKRFFEQKDSATKQFNKEIDVLRLMRHPNLVSLYGCSTSHSSNLLMLVYEYISNGTLSMHLCGSSAGKLAWLTRLNIAIETSTALLYLHDSGIIHRDVKSSNILLDENFNVKVGDFGLSRSIPDSVTHVSTLPAGTYAYIDPNYYETGRVSDKSDVYSFGVVLFELISSKPPRVSEGLYSTLAMFGVSKILNKELDELVDPSLGFDSDKNVMEMMTAVAELAFQCVQCPRELRPSMKQVLETLEGIKNGTWGFNQIT